VSRVLNRIEFHCASVIPFSSLDILDTESCCRKARIRSHIRKSQSVDIIEIKVQTPVLVGIFLVESLKTCMRRDCISLAGPPCKMVYRRRNSIGVWRLRESTFVTGVPDYYENAQKQPAKQEGVTAAIKNRFAGGALLFKLAVHMMKTSTARRSG